MNAPILDVRDLRISISGDEGIVKVLDHVRFTMRRGRIFGLVGESGCGKSTLIRAILGILPPRGIVEHGSIRFRDVELLALDERALERDVRGNGIGFVPQDPFLALNPVFTVGSQLLASMQAHSPLRRSQWRDHLIGIMRRVRLYRPEMLFDRYPHQLSGGQRQRVLIAGALALTPQLIVADEPTTALDLITQRQILALLKELVRDMGLSLLLVTHDLGVAAQLCDDIGVMYAGQVVESGPAGAVLQRAKHPYTAALLACHPERSDRPTGIAGQVSSPLRAPPGCRFAPRCGSALQVCSSRAPMLRPIDHQDHWVDCRLFDT